MTEPTGDFAPPNRAAVELAGIMLVVLVASAGLTRTGKIAFVAMAAVAFGGVIR